MDIATAQLEIGASATQYIPPKDEAEELNRCLPFFEILDSTTGLEVYGVEIDTTFSSRAAAERNTIKALGIAMAALIKEKYLS